MVEFRLVDGQPLAVGRPRRAAGDLLRLGDPTQAGAVRADDVDFRGMKDLESRFPPRLLRVTVGREGDPLAAFGGIVALNKPVDLLTAQTITGIDRLLEVIVAPSYAPDALELLRSRWKNVRLLEVGPVDGFKVEAGGFTGEHHMHVITGGYLVQQRDVKGFDQAAFKVVSKRPPTEAEWADLRVAWLACKHLKSNAIALAKGGMMVGGGAGQQDRVNACRIAVAKAGARSLGAVAGSDAFFPFPDGPKLLLEAGITAIIHPGGSVRDGESLAAVDEAGAAMVLTGERHFKH